MALRACLTPMSVSVSLARDPHPTSSAVTRTLEVHPSLGETCLRFHTMSRISSGICRPEMLMFLILTSSDSTIVTASTKSCSLPTEMPGFLALYRSRTSRGLKMVSSRHSLQNHRSSRSITVSPTSTPSPAKGLLILRPMTSSGATSTSRILMRAAPGSVALITACLPPPSPRRTKTSLRSCRPARPPATRAQALRAPPRRR
mmetsp:Transcript_72183/g.192995  ORF Transcript_72183/g.192995 Transcript_72183/m.192995 type:complete len:202 (-) Transcript_72183:13-618(-)